MLVERAQVMLIEQDCLWVETFQASTCGSCVAKKGCGQSLLAKWSGRSHYLRVLLGGRSPSIFRVGDQIEIGVPEDVVVLSSLLAYLAPLILLVLGVAVGHYFSSSEWVSVAGAALGLLIGAGVIRWYAAKHRSDLRFQPVVLDSVLPSPVD